MTRSEAELKLFQAKIPRDINGEYYIIGILEALGVLKFEPEEQVLTLSKGWLKKAFTEEMRKAGYKPDSIGTVEGLEAIDRIYYQKE